MKTIMQVEYTPVYVTLAPNDMEQGKVYISEEFNTAIHKCLCGCGEKVVMPLAHGDGFFRNKGWNIIKEANGTVSFSPSVGNFQSKCNTHYIMTKNKANFV